MNNPRNDLDQWRQRLWRGPISPSEHAELEAWLKRHPEARPDWELEEALAQRLEQLPVAPVPSNFTARVLESVRVEGRRERPTAVNRNWWSRWLPRAAIASLIAAAGLITLHQAEENRRAGLLRGVTAVAEVSSLPSPQILQDFDVIMALGQAPPADEQLLTLFE